MAVTVESAVRAGFYDESMSTGGGVVTDDADGTVGFTLSGSDPVVALREHVSDHQFLNELSFTPRSFEDGVFRATVPYDERYANPGPHGSLHGGIVVSILDTAMGYAVLGTLIDDDALNSGPTINLNVNFLAPATDDMVVEAEVVRIGSSNAVVDGRITTEGSGDLVATGQGSWRIYDLN